MKLSNTFLILLLAFFGAAPAWSQVEKAGGEPTAEEQYNLGKKALEEQDKEEESKGKKFYAYIRFWNMAPSESPSVAILLKTAAGVTLPGGNDTIVVNYEFQAGTMTSYRRIPEGKYEIGLFKPPAIGEGGLEAIRWDKLEAILKGREIDLKRDTCLTIILNNNGTYSLALYDDKDDPSYGNKLRILDTVSNTPVEIGYLQGEKETLLWKGSGPAEESKDFPAINKRIAFFVDIMKKGVKVRKTLELDCTFIHSHSILVFTDPYGRVVARQFEDGLKAAISSQ